jgi:hypothetical protein
MIPLCVQVDAMKHTLSETHVSPLTMSYMNKDAAFHRIAKNVA